MGRTNTTGAVVRQAIEKEGYSLRQIEAETGIDPTSISRWARDVAYPSDQRARKVAEFLGIIFDKQFQEQLALDRTRLKTQRYAQRHKEELRKMHAESLDRSGKTHAQAAVIMRAIEGSLTITPISLVPLYGKVPGSIPHLTKPGSIGDAEGIEAVPDEWVNEYRNTICFQFSSDSMTPNIAPGDYITVRTDIMPESGDMAIVLVNDEATVKRYNKLDDAVILISDNPKYQPIYVAKPDDLVVVGKVVGTLRKY